MAFRFPFRRLATTAVAAAERNLWRSFGEQIDRNFEELENAFLWKTYTPTFTASTTNPTLGTGGSVLGRYLHMGDLVFVEIDQKFGSSGMNPGSGSYRFSVPVRPALPLVGDLSQLGGLAELWDVSAGDTMAETPEWLESSNAVVLRHTFLGTSNALVGDATPWVWAANDEIHIRLFYVARSQS